MAYRTLCLLCLVCNGFAIRLQQKSRRVGGRKRQNATFAASKTSGLNASASYQASDNLEERVDSRLAAGKDKGKTAGPRLAWHFEANTNGNSSIVVCSATLCPVLLIEKVSEWCCQIKDGYYWNPFVPKHCYTVLHLYDRRAPQDKWWVLLELFSSDEHGSEEEGDATIACAASRTHPFDQSSAAAYSHVCHNKGFPVGYVERTPEDPKEIADLAGVHTFTDQYVLDHPHYNLAGDNCQMYSISVFNAIVGTNYRRKQAFQARTLAALPNGTLDMIEGSLAYSGGRHEDSDDEHSPHGE